jgi:predicted nucleotidyltransferase
MDRLIEKYRKDALPKLMKEFKPDKVILFGSRAKGNAQKSSDIDLIVIAPFFKDIPFLKRMPLVLKKVPFPSHVDYICYTREEYENIKDASSVIMDAREQSVELTI